MKLIRSFVFAVAAAVVAVGPAARAAKEAPPPLKQGDRIVFLGDSITAAAVRPQGFVTLIRNTLDTAHKDLGAAVFGAGVSGNKVPNLQARLEKDVLARKPTIVFIYIGINDVWHWRKNKEGVLAGGTPTGKYEAGLKDIIGRINAAGARVILCTPSVIGEKPDGTNARDKMLEEYAAISRKVAAETGSRLLDLRKVFLDYLKTHNTENRPRGVLTRDSVHLNPKGNRLVAAAMCKALGIELAEPPAAGK